MPPLPIAGALIGGAASIIQSGLNSYAVSQQNKRNYELWKEQNEYNLPKNQVERLKEAGLSPALMYQGGSAGGQAGAAPSTERNSIDITQLGSIISTFLDLKSKDVAIENQRKTGKVIDSKIIQEYYDAMTKERQSENEMERIRNRDDIQLSNTELKRYESGRYSSPGDVEFIPKAQMQDAQLKNLAQELEISKSKKVLLDHAIDMTERERWEFIQDKKRYKEYDILPSDSEQLQFFKIIAKDIFNTNIANIKDHIISIFK